MLLPNENPFQQQQAVGAGSGDPMMMLMRLFAQMLQRPAGASAPGATPGGLGAPPPAGAGAQNGNSTVIAPIYGQATVGAGGGSGAPSSPTTPTTPPPGGGGNVGNNPNWWNGFGLGGGI